MVTLDREEREQIRKAHTGTYYGRPFPFCDECGESLPCEVHRLLDRIEDLEEAVHASRLRREDLEALRDELNGLFVEENDRAEGYRKAAIILRDKVSSLLDAIERREEHASRVIARLERELDATEQDLAAERGGRLW